MTQGNHAAAQARARAPFPENLTPAERRAVDALIEAGTYQAAAELLGRSRATVNTQLQQALYKADLTSSVQLVAAYVKATTKPSILDGWRMREMQP